MESSTCFRNLFFKPWVGKYYNTGGIFNKKLLVVGESHYCEGCERCEETLADSKCHEFTNDVVTQIINGETTRFSATFRKFEKSLIGDKDATSEQIWQSIAFYNYLQSAVAQARKGGDYEGVEKLGKSKICILIND